jgi:hypothetical protein
MDWFVAKGVSPTALRGPPLVLVAHGVKADDGLFDEDEAREDWLVFPEAEDCIYWQPRSGEMARWNGRNFALGQDLIGAAATHSFGGRLHIFQDPLDWLRAGRKGLVIVDWSQTFDRLRDCLRIAVAEGLLDKLKAHLQPPHLPEILVLREQREVVA